jgi:hypothetical protein
MVTERMIINALILGASFILVPFIISQTLTVGDYLPILVLIVLVGLVISFFLIKERLAICPYLAGSISGALNFLPLQLNGVHVACFFLILYYVTGYVIIRQKTAKLGKPAIIWPLAVVVGIVLYHNHNINVGILGGNSEGGKPAILMYLVVLGYFCSINLPTPSVLVLSRIPRYSLILVALTSIPYLLTTVVPGLAPYLYRVTDNVNVESYVDSVNGVGSAHGFAKLAALGPLGSCLQLYLLCHYPIGTWFQPRRLWVLILSLFCLISVSASGYRSDVFGYFATLVAGAWCYYSWRAMLVPTIVMLAGLSLFTLSSNNIIDLPLRKLPFIFQRTLSFIPGDWDPDAIESGKSSNEFRENIAKVYMDEYMDRSPLFGNGFTINVDEFNHWQNPGPEGRDIMYAQAKVFIEGKMFHTGWIAAYDCVGIIGTGAFVILAINLLRINGRLLFGPTADKRSSLYPTYAWIFCSQFASFAAYWTVFGAFGSEMIGLIVNAMILSHLMDLSQKAEAPLDPVKIQGHVEMPRISGAYYGRR